MLKDNIWFLKNKGVIEWIKTLIMQNLSYQFSRNALMIKQRDWI